MFVSGNLNFLLTNFLEILENKFDCIYQNFRIHMEVGRNCQTNPWFVFGVKTVNGYFKEILVSVKTFFLVIEAILNFEE